MSSTLHRGMNIGGVLDARLDNDRRLPLLDSYVDEIAEAGFDTVRLPVCWSAHAGEQSPFTIAPTFFDRVDAAVEQVLSRGLDLVLDVHHYEQLQRDPAAHADRFLALWQQIAERYRDRDTERIAFELLNEPREQLTADRWNDLLRLGLAEVRATSPDRTVLIGPARLNAVDALGDLRWPDDENLVVTVHYYEPFAFTHQAAPWLDDAHRWLGTPWGTPEDRVVLRRDLATAAQWAGARGVPLFVGEFGTYAAADRDSRVRWTTAVRTELERLGVGWCYWDFATDFGVFDPAGGTWHEPLRAALLGGTSR